jgi:pimeloyl-ACP methyl ester carboxylesterase
MEFDRRQLLAAGAALPFAGAARAADAWSEVGPYEVATVEQMDIVDTVGGRKILTRAYYPAKPGRYPGIVFSHGFGGSLKTFPNTGKVWASHGYVVLHPTHIDSLGFPDPKVEPADAEVMRKFRENRAALDPATREAFVHVLDHPYFIASRLDDVSCLLRLWKAGGSGMDETVRGRTDTTRLGMSGHSFGGYTTLVCAGARLDPSPGRPVPQGFSGFLMMSGQGPGRMGLSDGSFGGLTKPFMATTGTRDFGAANETPPWRLRPYDLSPPGNKYALVVDGFRHSDFDPPVGDSEMGARGSALHRTHIDFWNTVLKKDPAGFRDLDALTVASKQGDPVWIRRR